ncbi:sodium- and chloride-dependent transporter [Campylobacter sputorum subsp. bubulus]|uniref:Sodium- and chloride-dependent transporter n=1 Tax=Campylobacter sputorum subsp. sputorum TaxID=32024 RepID=A0A381DJF3_9BACT|nr:sodium-dependent transporter [Campylobacter sputorum]ASM35697.1 Na+-dependent transporter, SNF family [Campylobacter sputorum aubsp. sputorum RM3237]KAB0582573.1 sodium-dependent transporter [Campylobacter sputorum subsp. sputorum]QEL05889.1 sodium-dependent transporter, SNF family [Campylobacter sputorum subsp. sputorum]SUX07855.1 sodium- and chloride-dependent transporter [Campylobacter sputorum subsp. bubulus]SUX10667.1 sodium- and chloride-dependent transporter [Campylobacter sputorum s
MNEKFSRIGFILAVAGSAVGLGNAWKFPTLVGQNGGSAFILLYLILTLSVSFVIFLAEIVIGRLSESDAVNAFRKLAPNNKEKWKFAGFFMIGALLIYSFYSVVMGWILKYTVTIVVYLPKNIDESGATFNALLGNDFFVSFICFTICSLVSFYIVSKGVKNGIEKLNVWMMPALFILLLLMVAYSLSYDGFLKSLSFLLVPDFSALNKDSVLSALGLAFFTLSLGVTTIITYAASLPEKTNILTSSLSIVFINILIGIMMGLVVFTFIFEFNADPSQQGPGLIFISLTVLFAKLGIIGNILAFAFFLSLLFAAITSAISMIEPSIYYLVNSHNMTRKNAIIAIFIFTYILGVFCILGYYSKTADVFSLFGKSFFDILDYLTSNIMMPLSGIVTSIFVGFVMKKGPIEILLRPYMGKKLFNIWYVLLRYVAPFAVLVIMINQVFFS